MEDMPLPNKEVAMPSSLKTLTLRIYAWLSRDAGQGLTEYALILALIAIVAIAGLHLLGGKVNDALSTVGSSIQS
jgi:Flp pilus assembly pilin Flp